MRENQASPAAKRTMPASVTGLLPKARDQRGDDPGGQDERDRQRQLGQSGLERGVAEDLLHRERQEVEEPERGGAGEEHRQVRPGHGAQPEDVEGDQRSHRASLDGDERAEQRGGRGEDRERSGRGPTVGLGLHDPDFAIHTADDGPRTRLGSGELVPERVIPASQRSMAVILDAIDALPAARKPRRALPAALVAELGAWTERVGRGALPPGTLLGGVVFWSRLHGLISLELDHHLASMQLDPELLYRAELAELGGET